MKGDFSKLTFDPREHERGVAAPADGALRNLSGVLYQQGRVTLDADLTDGELIDLGWQRQAGRDVIGAGVCAVPVSSPEGFRIDSALVSDGSVHLSVRPGRAWVDGVLARLPGRADNPAAPVERIASYFGPPLADPQPSSSTIADRVRDVVVVELWDEPLHGFQYPERLIEPALGGPDTSERSSVAFRFRLLRLAAGENCRSILGRLGDDSSVKGRLSVSLAPVTLVNGDCPVVGGGGFTGFEHSLYRIEIAEANPGAPVRFQWSPWNAGLAGRGRFDATRNPPRVTIDAGRAAILSAGRTDFYLEALQYDERGGAWQVIYATNATLTVDHFLDLATPPAFGALPATNRPVFFRLWNGVHEVSAFTNTADPVELADGIRLGFEAPASGRYAPGDYWTFSVRAGEIGNPQVLLDAAPPIGIVYHRVPVAEITWTSQQDTTFNGAVEDCRVRFASLTSQKVCCTYLVGDGVNTFGDFNALEEAAAHLPADGGELCLLPGIHRANLVLDGRRDVRVHGCSRRSLLLPRSERRAQPVISALDCSGIEIVDLDIVTVDGAALLLEGRRPGACQNLRVHGTRIIARTNAIRTLNVGSLSIADNRLQLLDTAEGRAALSIGGDELRVERNVVVLLPLVTALDDAASGRGGNQTIGVGPPAAVEDPYEAPDRLWQLARDAWNVSPALVVPTRPYRATGGIHLRAGSSRVRVADNVILGGAGNGVTLGGDLEAVDGPRPAQAPFPAPSTSPFPGGGTTSVGGAAVSARTGDLTAPASESEKVTVVVPSPAPFLVLVQGHAGRPVAGVDVYLEGETVATDRTDAQGMASIKTAPGVCTLDVAPAYRVVRVSESRDGGGLVTTVTVAARTTPPATRGFLHEIDIEANDISQMGLSGIGFALRAGTRLAAPTTAVPAKDPKGALLAYTDQAVLDLALTTLVRATDPVRDLAIRRNRIHQNLRAPFDALMLSEAQVIGRGGISIAIVDSAVITGNLVQENGRLAADPVCGAFVGFGANLEIADNTLTANGADDSGYLQNRRAGIRGGVFIRFAVGSTGQFSTAGRRPALRIDRNLIDQSAGRALTAYALGPVSASGNQLNSEHTGQLGFVDTAAGGVAILNLGGIHRVLADRAAFIADKTFAAAAEQALPGGETTFDGNHVRLGAVNQSLTSQLMIVFDDLSFASNISSAFAAGPLFANVMLIADTVRATGSRFRESAVEAISLLTQAARLNISSLNQADHCVVVRPAAEPPALVPTIGVPNQVLDDTTCAPKSTSTGLGTHAVGTLAAHAAALGGTLPQNAFTAVELASLSRHYTGRAIATINSSQIAIGKEYQAEAGRLTAALGATHPTTVAVRARAEAGAETARLLAIAAETAVIQPPAATPTTASISGRFVNTRDQGQAGYVVELIGRNGAPVDVVGVTDASGFFSTSYDRARAAALEKEGDLVLRVMDPEGREVFRSREAIRIQPGVAAQTTCVVPLRVVPRSVTVGGTVIFGAAPAPAVRTPLETLEIDDRTRARLEAAGIRDAEAVLEVTMATLVRSVGDRPGAQQLREIAKQRLAGAARRPPRAPKPRPRPKKRRP